MGLITTNASKLSLADKLVKGQEIITKSTTNPDVPGNATVLAAFSTSQTALQTAMNNEVAARGVVTQKMTLREDAQRDWTTKLNALAGFTESATNGNPGKIESAGFGVRAPRTPTQPLPAPEGLVANTNGTPGLGLSSRDHAWRSHRRVVRPPLGSSVRLVRREFHHDHHVRGHQDLEGAWDERP